MTEQTEASFAADDEDAEWVSKSQLKRDSKALQELGKKLTQLSAAQLARVPLDTRLLDAIALAHKLANKRGALKRHYQFIGKLLRTGDAEPIMQAVAAMEAEQAESVHKFKRLEQWRDRILAEGDDAVQEFCREHPLADRQQLRQIWRNHQHAAEDKKNRFARLLFKALREAS